MKTQELPRMKVSHNVGSFLQALICPLTSPYFSPFALSLSKGSFFEFFGVCFAVFGQVLLHRTYRQS
jgi:hypothetical protein